MGGSQYRLGTVVVVTVVIAVFGPYVASGSIRTEQAAIYGLLLALLPFRLRKLHVPRYGAELTFAWAAYAAIGIIGAHSATDLISRWLPGSTLAGIDNLLLPAATMLLVWTAVPKDTAPVVLNLAAKVIAYATAANGVLAILMTQFDLSIFLRPFVAPEGDTSTVAERAAQLGRVAGVFGQPAEAGLAYGIGGLAACYVWRNKLLRMYLVLAPIIVGGLLSVSKIFILGALPLILWRVWRNRNGNKAVLVILVAAAPLGLAESGFVQDWVGIGYLGRLFHSPPSADLISFYTASRFGSQSTLTDVINEVTRLDPWVGVGASGLQVPYDNGWVEAFVVSGIIGIVCYTATLLIIFIMGRTDTDETRRAFVTALALFATGASIGLPAMTANRAGSLLWLLVALAALAHPGSGPTYISSPPTTPTFRKSADCPRSSTIGGPPRSKGPSPASTTATPKAGTGS